MKNQFIKWMKNCIFATAGVLCLSMLNGLPVHADQGTVLFGSTEYTWECNKPYPIGVYIKGDETISSYEVCLKYDSKVLRYLDGATEQDGELLYIRGTGSADNYRVMLNFETLRPGNTQIVVQSANYLTAEQAAFSIPVGGSAPISVTKDGKALLSELTVQPGKLEGFESNQIEYTVEVPAGTEQIQVSYIPTYNEATVTVSDTRLHGEETLVTVLVENEQDSTEYLVHVKRPVGGMESGNVESTEPSSEELESGSEVVFTSEEISEEESDEGENKEEEDEAIIYQLSDKAALIQNIILAVGVLFTACLLLWYLIMLVREKKEEKKNKKSNDEEFNYINLENTVIKVSNVTMRFKMAQDEASSLKEYLIKAIKGQNTYTYLTALNHISFEVKQGDVVGIIGTNGSGKSTMLKIVSGALRPTSGKVEVDRSKVQMLTLGTGFDMELTARENVYLNGSIIGYTREYIDEKYDEIVKFAELEGFMEERMKNFSSGMVSRLGFAIATMRDAPDILILDEVLSVGDMFFRKKSLARIKEMIHGGATVLIVSHSMDTILKNCNKVVWIEKGELKMVGDAKKVCEAYGEIGE